MTSSPQPTAPETTAPETTTVQRNAPPTPAQPQVLVGGIPVVRYSRTGLADAMVADWERQKAGSFRAPARAVLSANGHSISMFASDPAFRALIDAADMVHADGMSVVTASRLLASPGIPERCATTDFFHDAAVKAAESGMSFYLLGASAEIIEQAVAVIRRQYPSLSLAGYRDGFFTDADLDGVVDDILAVRPDVLWIGVGRPRQERLAIELRDRLTGVTWIKTCGGLFDFLSGRASRAPDWMQRFGLEWLYRMGREPRRLFWRYAVTNPHAIYRMLIATRRLPDAPLPENP